MQRFDGKVVIVTGAGAGIGAAIARRLADEGAQLVLAGRTGSKLEDVASTIDGGVDRVICHQVDVATEAEVERLILRTVEIFGRIDALVNNAGVGHLGRIGEVTLDVWRGLFATDVESIFVASRAAMPHLRESRGAIVNIASISGVGGDYGMNLYNAAKGAVINFTRGLALDCGEYGVRVNAVSPGLIETPAVAGIMAKGRVLWDERVPLGRPGFAQEIAAATAFLASGDASYVTGHNLIVDGGLTAHTGQPSLLRLYDR